MSQGQLSSWKEIATHLGVSVRTAQRWETLEGLPVRRHPHAKLGSVYADPAELRRWWERRPGEVDPSIAVLPFTNLDRDEETEILSDGLTEDLITALSQVRHLRVVARSSVFFFKGKAGDLREIGSSLGVGHILEGSVRRSGSRLRVSAQLVSAEDGCHLWAERFDREMEDPFDLQDQLAQAITASLRGRLLEEPRAGRRTRDTETYNVFLRGRFFWKQRNQQDLMRALRCFGQVVASEPDFAAAYAGMADCYCFLWAFADRPWKEMQLKAEAGVSRALELDPLLGDAHTSLGLTRICRLDIPGAEAAFRRALELNRGDHSARHWRAMTLSTLGHHDEALEEIEHALELDPFGVTVNQDTGRILYSMGRHEEAILRLRHTLEIAPQARFGPIYLALALMKAGDYDGALAAVSEDPVFHAFVRARSGDREAARKQLERVGKPPLSFTRRAILHLGLGQEKRALRLFDSGLQQPELEGLELVKGMAPFFQDPALRAELDSFLNQPRSGGPNPG